MKPLKRKRVVLGMDGRMPSKIAASLLRNQGYDVFPLYLKIDLVSVGEDPDLFPSAFRGIDEAEMERFCESLGVTLTKKDVTPDALVQIYDPLWMATLSGLPDMPELRWVAEVLIPKLRGFAEEIGAEWISTAHFAQNRDGIYRYPDSSLDQSAAFARSVGKTADLLLPMGEVSPIMIVRLARELGLLRSQEETPDDQILEKIFMDERLARPRFHFTRDLLKNPAVQSKAPGYFTPGTIRDREGVTYGEHRGLPFYPVGRAVESRPGSVVIGSVPETRAVLVGSPAELLANSAYLQNCRLGEVTSGGTDRPYRAQRLSAETIPAVGEHSGLAEVRLFPFPGELAEVHFELPGRPLTRGQEVIFYEGFRLLGAGRVAERRQVPPGEMLIEKASDSA